MLSLGAWCIKLMILTLLNYTCVPHGLYQFDIIIKVKPSLLIPSLIDSSDKYLSSLCSVLGVRDMVTG